VLLKDPVPPPVTFIPWRAVVVFVRAGVKSSLLLSFLITGIDLRAFMGGVLRSRGVDVPVPRTLGMRAIFSFSDSRPFFFRDQTGISNQPCSFSKHGLPPDPISFFPFGLVSV